MAPWCSGLTCHPVTVEIAGSNPVGVARPHKSWSCFPFSLKTVQGNGDGIGADGDTFNPWPRANTANFSRQKPIASLHAFTWITISPLNTLLGPLRRRPPPLYSLPPHIPHGCLPPPALYLPSIYPQPSDRFRIVLSACFQVSMITTLTMFHSICL